MPTHEMFPYLCVHDANKAIAFYCEVFGMRELFRLAEPSGRIGHAELDFHGATLMLAEEFPEHGFRSAKSIGATPVTVHLHVPDCDEVIERALKAGATLEMAAQDQFYGERSGNIRDPFGHRWNIGHHIEDVTPEEMQRRYTEILKAGELRPTTSESASGGA